MNSMLFLATRNLTCHESKCILHYPGYSSPTNCDDINKLRFLELNLIVLTYDGVETLVSPKSNPSPIYIFN